MFIVTEEDVTQHNILCGFFCSSFVLQFTTMTTVLTDMTDSHHTHTLTQDNAQCTPLMPRDKKTFPPNTKNPTCTYKILTHDRVFMQTVIHKYQCQMMCVIILQGCLICFADRAFSFYLFTHYPLLPYLMQTNHCFDQRASGLQGVCACVCEPCTSVFAPNSPKAKFR